MRKSIIWVGRTGAEKFTNLTKSLRMLRKGFGRELRGLGLPEFSDGG